MKLSKFTNALRTEPLPLLVAEAGWRTLRSTRKTAFRVSTHGDACPIHFRPIGYYQLQQDAISAHARQSILTYAEAIVGGRYPLMGYGIPALGPHPDWHCDWVSGKSWPLAPSRRLQLVRHDGSDVKAPWELSRMQWSPIVAKAWVLTGDTRYRAVLESLLTDWLDNNPIGKGIHWANPMEAALRAISLCLTMDLLWPFAEQEQPWLKRLEQSLWQHLRFIEVHSEFSWLLRSNHYLSNIIGLTTLSACLQGPGMARRRVRYARAVQQEVVLQTYADGGDREASTGYHVLVAQMALHSLLVQQKMSYPIEPAFQALLRRMFEWMATLADDEWTLPLIGDCDNGRVELTLDDLEPSDALRVGNLIGLASHVLQQPLMVGAPHLAGFLRDVGFHNSQDAIWFGYRPAVEADQRNSEPCSLLADSGLAVLRTGGASAIFCAMPNGLDGKGSHHHCDKLSFILRLPLPITHSILDPIEVEVFSDPGTRGYTRSAKLRNADRSTRAHNTLSIDQREQNTISLNPNHLFQSGDEASVSRIVTVKGDPLTVSASHRGYAGYGIEHKRTLQLCEHSLHLLDEISANPLNDHLLDLHFTLGPEWHITIEKITGEHVSCLIAGPRPLTLDCEAASHLTLMVSACEISRAYGTALPGISISISTTTRLPASLRTTVRWN